MSSVYRDTEGQVTFTHPIGTDLTATITDASGKTLYMVSPISSVGGVYTLDVPWAVTQYDGMYNILWEGEDVNSNAFSRTQQFEVVTPLVPLSDLMTIYDNTGVAPTDAEVADLEKTVRVVIERWCGQSFGWSVGTRNYVGNGSGKIILNERCNKLSGILGGWGMYDSDYTTQQLDSNGVPVVDGSGNPVMLTNVNGELNLDRAGLIQDGWDLLIQWPEFLTVKEAPPTELLQFAPSQDGTIRVPRRYFQERDTGTQYSLYGEWGYSYVPDEVQEAAMLLGNDYASGDSGYRDRYLSILKIQQDSLTYHAAAFRGTGNARVDLLLGKYRRANGLIII